MLRPTREEISEAIGLAQPIGDDAAAIDAVEALLTKAVPDVTAAVALPGDTLVMGFAANLSRQQAEEIKARVLEACPALADVVLAAQCTGLAVARPQ